ncbi:hypothetical protein BKI51_02605 [Alphaproteobacteria bacterium AO1-B]|nr:hypothetical protein BKI51_02605 [Alphaproteobacteria bacterium AO1-B]
MSQENGFKDYVLKIASERNAGADPKSIQSVKHEDEPFINDSDDSPGDLNALFDEFNIIEPPLGDVEELWDPRIERFFNRNATLREEFEAFFSNLGLVYFQPHELLVMGGNNASGPCKGKNGIPPKSLWPNMVPTILALDEIRGLLGYRIRTTSVYRSPEYNECLRVTLGNSGVAKFSQHLNFRAIDFAGYQGVPSDWGNAVEKVREKWGLWTRTYKSFVHIDSRNFKRTN